MSNIQLANLFLEYSDDIIWMIDSNFSLVYANHTFQNVMKQVNGKKIKIGETIFTKNISEGEIEKWKANYERGFNGEHFEVVDHFYNPKTNDTHYIQVTFKPVVNKDQTIDKIACQSRDISSFIKSNNEAEKLLDASLDVICSIDKHGIFTKVSAACKELWGYKKHELIGKPYISFVIEEDVESTNQAAADIINGIAKTTFENRYKRKDGGIAFNVWSARYDPKTQIMFCVARDAREKIKKEELLVVSEQRFKALVQEGADMISIIDADGNYIYTSPTTSEILGITPQEFDGNSVFDFIHPDDIKRVAGYMQRIRTENKVIAEAFRLRDGNNEWRWVETVLTNMVENPAIRGIVANSRDVTDKKNETQRLKLLESVITNTKDSVLITEAEPFDLPGPRILYVNEAFTRMTGYTAEEVIGKTPRILQGPKSDRTELARLSKAMRNWESCEITTVNYKKNGEEFWINFSLTPVADETGWYTHWIAIERDVTEQKNLEIANDLTTKISTIFNEEVDLHGALTKLCEEVAVNGFFSFCEIWLTDIQENLLELKTVHKRDEAANIFYENSKRTHFFKKGQGVPGMVWKNGDALIWENKGKNNELLVRAAAAEKAGIKTVVGFPLIFHDKIIGVLQFGAQSNLKTLEWITNVLSDLSLFIGAEIGRKKTENDLTRIFEFAPDIIATCGFDGFFKTVNPYTTELFGYTEKEFTSKPLTAFLHPDDAQITANALEKLTSGEPIYNFKNRYITKSGDIKTISWNCSPVVEDELFFFIGKDMTEEIKMTNLLKDSNQMSRIGSWEVDLINNSIFWSDITYQIHETPKNFIPQIAEALNFYREDFREQITKAVSTCVEVGTPFDLEAVIITANNKESWVRAMGKAEIINGVCVRIYGSFQDIDDYKQSEIRLQSLASNLPGVIYQYIISPDGTDSLKNVSSGSEALWGFSSEALIDNIQLIWDRIKAGVDFEKVQKSIAHAIEFKTNWTCRYKYMMPSGELRTHLGNGTPTFYTDGTILFNSIILDVTQEAKNEELLNEVANIARIGSWEKDFINHDGDSIYWSPILREIVEVDESYNPTLTGGIEFHVGESKERIQKAIDLLIADGIEFDEEVLLRSSKGNERWNRCIGKREMVNGKCTRIYGSYQDIHQRKESQLELLAAIKKAEESDARFKAYTEQSPIAIYITDINGDYIYANETWLEIAGMQLEDALGNGWMNALHPEDSAYVTDNWYKSIKYNGEWNYEYRFVNSNKDIIWVNGSAKKLFNDKNEQIGYLGSNVNITKRKQTESKLIESENYLRTILDNEPECVKVVNSKGELLSMNPAGLAMIEADNEQQVLGYRLTDLIHDEYKFGFNRLRREVFKGNSRTFEFEITGLKGGYRWLETHAVPLKDAKGKVVNLLGVTRDITKRKKVEKEIKLANDRFEKVTEATNDVIWDWDIERGTFIRSIAIDNFFGAGASKVLDKKDFWKDNFHEEDLSKIKSSLQKALEDPDCKRWEEEYRILNNNNEIIFVIDRGLIIRNKNGKAIRMVGAMSDISDIKHHQVELLTINKKLNIQAIELQRSNEELEQFAFIASHDLQEPLRMISSFMDLLKRKYGERLDEKGLQYIHFATDGAKRMKQIILDLLLYSRANKTTEENELINLNEIVSEYTQLRRKVIAEKSASITNHGLPSIETYRAPISQIFHCLLDNALKYVDENKSPEIEISAIEKENVWQFAIKDNGIGIDPKFFNKIFIIFQRLQNRKDHDGTGIGLAVTKRSIEFLGGEVWVESEINKGATFYFTLLKIKQLL